MPKKRVWTMERAMINGNPVKSTNRAVEYHHICCNGQGKNRVVVEFVTGPIGKFLVMAANEMEAKR